MNLCVNPKIVCKTGKSPALDSLILESAFLVGLRKTLLILTFSISCKYYVSFPFYSSTRGSIMRGQGIEWSLFFLFSR